MAKRRRVKVRFSGTTPTLRSYGVEQALRDIGNLFVGAGWWYPRHAA